MATYTKIAVGITLVALLLTACGSDPRMKYVSLAKCLTEKGAVMYGAYWCPHCANQKKMFGKEAFQYVTYVECDARGYQGDPKKCEEKNVKSFPTWVYGDGSRTQGERTPEQLAEKTGCALLEPEPTT